MSPRSSRADHSLDLLLRNHKRAFSDVDDPQLTHILTCYSRKMGKHTLRRVLGVRRQFESPHNKNDKINHICNVRNKFVSKYFE